MFIANTLKKRDGRNVGVSPIRFVRQWNELQQAERETGVIDLDSAAATYREACKRLGHTLLKTPVTGARTAFLLAKRQAAARPRALAADAKMVAARAERFPNANRLLNKFG